MSHTNTPLAVVVLAAGQGTRMKSGVHKVLHPIAGRPMLLHLLAATEALSPERRVVVVGGGSVAQRRLGLLVASGADVHLISRAVTPAVEAMATRAPLSRRIWAWSATVLVV